MDGRGGLGGRALSAAARNQRTRAHNLNIIQKKVVVSNSPVELNTTTFAAAPYLAFSAIRTSRQRLVAESGRVSEMSTWSPMPASWFSSWALNLLCRFMIFP